MLEHASSITYYPHGNGQAESTNKFIGSRLLTKLVDQKKIKLEWTSLYNIVFILDYLQGGNRLYTLPVSL
jgi:hypothetical protein